MSSRTSALIKCVLSLQIPRVVQLFISTRGLPAAVSAATGAAGVSGTFDSVAVDGLLNELRGLLACVQEFMAFLQRTAAAAVHPKPLPRELLDIFGDGEHMRAVMELQAAYLSLEAAYVKRSVAKAIEWDSLLAVRRCMPGCAIVGGHLRDAFVFTVGPHDAPLVARACSCHAAGLRVLFTTEYCHRNEVVHQLLLLVQQGHPRHIPAPRQLCAPRPKPDCLVLFQRSPFLLP